MKPKLTAALVALSIVLALPSFARPIQKPSLSRATRALTIDALFKQLSRVYVFPEVAKKMEAAIRRRQAQGAYDGITDGKEFAKRLTADLHKVRDDNHLEVQYFAGAIPYDSEKPPVATDVASFREVGRLRNYEYRKVERLEGGIGLLQIDGFYEEDWAQDTIVAAMTFLQNSEAIILDLRHNHGGAGPTLLTSYFFDRETHLADEYNRLDNTTRQHWTYDIVPGKKLADKDLYILTSRDTISAPEELAFEMQLQKRAVIVGETTHGGANPTTIFRVTDHFSAAIPFARLIHPGTDADLEHGVKPDIAVPSDQALIAARLMALKRAIHRHAGSPQQVANLKQALAEAEKDLAATKR